MKWGGWQCRGYFLINIIIRLLGENITKAKIVVQSRTNLVDKRIANYKVDLNMVLC